MIDDKQMRCLRGALGAMERTRAARALDAGIGGTSIVLGGNFQPDFALRVAVEIEFVAVARFVLHLPHQNFGKHAHLVRVTRTVLAKIFETPRTKIIAASLQYRRA